MNEAYIIQNGELYHYGIPGMKWGVRRFQDRNGRLTKAGKERYDTPSQKPKRYDKLYEKYKEAGYKDKDAARMAKGQIRTERTLMAVGGVTAAAAIAYGTYMFRDNRVDKFISPKQMIQTVHTENASDRLSAGNPFYATYKKADNTIYASKIFSHFGESSKVTQFYTDDGIKVASRKTGREVLNDMLESNSDFKKYVSNDLGLKGAKSKDRYDIFNQFLVYRTGGPDGVDHDKYHNMFYKELRKRGYGAVIDINDAKIEGFTFKPVIVFDKQNKHIISSTKATAKELGPERLQKARKLVERKQLIEHPLSSPTVSALATAGAASTVMNSIGAKAYITEYKRKHPDTSLTNFQLTTMYLNDGYEEK